MKTILKAIAVSALICSALLFGTPTVIVAGAPVPRTAYYPGDRYTTVYRPNEIPPPNGTKPPTVTIISPVNNSITASNNLTLAFNLTLEASTSYYPNTLDAVYYKPSWQPENTSLEIEAHNPFMKKTLPFKINITNMPNGTNSLTVYAYTICEYETSRELVSQPISQSGFIVGNFLYIYSNFYRKTGSSSVTFTIDPSANEPPPQPQAEGLPLGLIIAAGALATVTIATVGIFIYLKKRKRQAATTKN